MNKDKTFLQRDIYTTLDLLSDVGGFQGILMSFFVLTVTFMNTEYYEENLIR